MQVVYTIFSKHIEKNNRGFVFSLQRLPVKRLQAVLAQLQVRYRLQAGLQQRMV